ncbi:hypothetical protein ZIOFF_037505 [Zingiber officinale]|uniref:IPT/TIG domain-containing protein n=1 Tax=Zingiber officinale TaxID=94328 RepID=A0A8J5GBP9_ZINOF|nr:hypothetical protein ZIOFF_037505 [Zingiber officinale]
MPESILSSNDSGPTLRYTASICDNQENYFSRDTGFNDTGKNSSSTGLAEEVSSQLVIGDLEISQLNKMDRAESSNRLSLPELNQALRKLEQQLSLDSDEDDLASTKEASLPFSQVETHYLQLLDYEITNSQERALMHPPKILNSHTTDGAQPDSILINSDTRQSQFEAPVQTESSLALAQGNLFKIHEISPEWGFTTESTKVVIIGAFHCSPAEYTWAVLFGDTEVPLEIVQDGVFRCTTPLHAAGKVKLLITVGNKQPCSEIHEFEFRDKLKNTSYGNATQENIMYSPEELLLLVKFVQLLLSQHFDTTILQESNIEQEIGHLRKLKGSNDILEPIIRALLAGSIASKNIMDAILQELLKDKLYQWLSSRHERDTDKYQLSKRKQCVIHMISGLGFMWALRPILNSGIGINCRDSGGWTALHWAAYFGRMPYVYVFELDLSREEMVAALLVAGASARAVTNPSSREPEGKTPASLAAANGYKGLAGYLSEAALTTHLYSLTTEKTERSFEAASTEIDRGVETISQRSAVVDGGTEDQLSLKDSLAAARNASQAAARIQASFRSYSFRKKQQSAAVCRGKDSLSSVEIHKVSVTSSAIAPTTDSHVRAHLARKKYKTLLWTVNFLDKAILRWHRRGVGLRGFRAKQEFINEEEEDDIIKVFRKEKVDLATDEAASMVLSVVQSPMARRQYRRMLECYQQTKVNTAV